MTESRPVPKVGDNVFFMSGIGQVRPASVINVYDDTNPESPLDLRVDGVETRIGIGYSTTERIAWQWANPAPTSAPIQPNYEFDLDWLFAYHPPTPENVKQHEAIKAGARAFVEVIVTNSPASVDQTKAVQQVREAMYSAAAAVALEGRLYKQ